MHSVCCAKQSIALLKAGITRILRGAMRHVCGPSGHKQQKTLLFFAEEEYQNLIFLEICSCRIMRCCRKRFCRPKGRRGKDFRGPGIAIWKNNKNWR